jgi:uncharacterized protein
LPHNVMGLIGVANGMDGDLRTGLPAQMVDIHEPMRLLVVVEQKKQIVSAVLNSDDALREWFDNEWLLLATICPETGDLHRYRRQGFEPYEPLTAELPEMTNPAGWLKTNHDHLPVLMLN